MDKRIREIIKLANKEPGSLLEARILQLLKNPFLDNLREDVEKALKKIDSSKQIDNKSLDYIKGAFNFYLFTLESEDLYNLYYRCLALPADSSKSEENQVIKQKFQEKFKIANSYLKISETIEFILKIYNVDDSDIVKYKKEIRLHKVGTTSYLFCIKSVNKILKCIKLKYTDIPNIQKGTKEYGEQFNDIDMILNDHIPTIYSCKENYIIMEYISGCTLREYSKQIKNSFSRKLLIDKISTIWQSLCDILKNFAQKNIYHLDLSPENILIKEIFIDGKKCPKIYLIDFGYNYIVGEEVSTSVTILKAELYMAPELSDKKPKRSKENILSDIYSLGVILLEMLSYEELNSREMLNLIEEIRLEYSGLGQILEQILDDNIKTRLFQYPKTCELYEIIKEIVNDELKIYIKFYLSNTSKFQKLKQIIDVFFPSISKIFNGFREICYLKKNNIKSQLNLSKFLMFSIITQIAYISVFLILIHVRLKKILFSPHNYIDHIPAYLVAISFSFVATQYYLNIFYRIETKFSKMTNFFLRLNSFCFAIPILYTILIDYKAWAYCSGIGVFFVSMNNLLNYKSAKKSKKIIEAIFSKSKTISTESFLKQYKGWWILTFLYCIFLIVLGYLLNNTVKISNNITLHLVDEWAYALIVVFISIKMFIFNSSALAPIIRNGLDKLYFWHEKAIIFQKKREVNKNDFL